MLLHTTLIGPKLALPLVFVYLIPLNLEVQITMFIYNLSWEIFLYTKCKLRSTSTKTGTPQVLKITLALQHKGYSPSAQLHGRVLSSSALFLHKELL